MCSISKGGAERLDPLHSRELPATPSYAELGGGGNWASSVRCSGDTEDDVPPVCAHGTGTTPGSQGTEQPVATGIQEPTGQVTSVT